MIDSSTVLLLNNDSLHSDTLTLKPTVTDFRKNEKTHHTILIEKLTLEKFDNYYKNQYTEYQNQFSKSGLQTEFSRQKKYLENLDKNYQPKKRKTKSGINSRF